MKTFLLPLLLLFTACHGGKSTDRLLAEVWERDQQVRHTLVELQRAVTAEGRVELIDSLVAVVERMERADHENQQLVDRMISNGLPADLSPASYRTIWIVIDHAPLDMQQKYLPLIEEMVAAGRIDHDAYALLFDRVAMKSNRPQRYGSQSVQFGPVDNQQLYLWPVESVADLDSLRHTVGLSPIAEYMQHLSEQAGIAVQFDPSITVDSLNQLRMAGE